MNGDSLNILSYTNEDSGDSSDEFIGSSTEVSREPIDFINEANDSDKEEYEAHDNTYTSKDQNITKPLSKNKFQFFDPKLNNNIFKLRDQNDSMIIGLAKKQMLYISGIFRLQIIKGGIVYNNNHYDSSTSGFTVWHPLVSSIAAIQSSYFSGWNEYIHIEEEYRDIVELYLKEFTCIVKISNSNKELALESSRLYPEFAGFWNDKKLCHNGSSKKYTFTILNEFSDHFNKLSINQEWNSVMEMITRDFKEYKTELRILVLGGKNTGKSSFLRILLENFKAESLKKKKTEDIYYFDTDPGQPEVSDPECISLSKMSVRNRMLGHAFIRNDIEMIKQIYLGSSSPQDFPNEYLASIRKLLESFENNIKNATSVINMPGWIKGFGTVVVNYIINNYKPTHIVILETNSSKNNTEEIKIPAEYEVDSYGETTRPFVFKINAHSQNPSEKVHSSLAASHIRTYKLLTHLHAISCSNYETDFDFEPLVHKAPLQISYGHSGITGIQFLEEFSNLNKEDIENSLVGTIVAINTCETFNGNAVEFEGSFPIIKKRLHNMKFLTLALIHSIDIKKSILNIYIPGTKRKLLSDNINKTLIIERKKTETPIQELNVNIKNYENVNKPFLSAATRKKHEHVWKVRKNIKRRGHRMK
ncbi:hypothetical protein TPHA_0K02230 [Tetrapisispora phaffii CBS 4417]|uniref:Polynucleotide 5'-hydroxyl-kinase GRC3 n=1 Tax=Tetrapisispora phaffii (strain ATCC 24235 / CBS 4417 / NBRC 1672 / NRRL Y-8282 / UCD 70-5) TaxID=1071381 RepID=G8BZM5_TETPH|nr:hypothetical protein TPHA_0K02230 [Tetrapisispora phaffii CBS 4417]CCE65353.1 hypothetical protein TPHA_0K02230 [Tetrapisispora phaffii CBS 4417]